MIRSFLLQTAKYFAIIACFVAPSQARQTPSPDPAPAATAPSADTPKSSAVQQAIRSVCRIETRVRGQVVGHGSGFVVEASNGRKLIVTNHHVVEDMDAAALAFADAEVILPLDLLAFDRHADLAVLRVKQAGAIDDRPALAVRVDAAVGDEIYAIGYPIDLGLTMTRGIVSGVRDHADLADIMGALPPSAALIPRWIQTDCTINRGNSGGPMVDAQGRVVAVSTWVLLRDRAGQSVSNTYFGASGATLAEFLKSVGDAAIPFPRSVQVSSASPAASAPSPTIPAAPPAKPVRLDEALNALNGFDRMARCATCKGSGTTTKVVEVGRRGTGVVTQPIKERQSVTCSTCSGVGFRTGTSINRATKRFADAAAALDRATDGIERFDRRVTTLFRDLAEDNSAGAAQALADFAAHETPALGEGIVGAGNIHTRVGFEVPNADGALVIGLPNQRIAVIRSFALRETAGNGPIFFVGAFAGRTTLDSGTELIVVDRAYVVRAKD